MFHTFLNKKLIIIIYNQKNIYIFNIFNFFHSLYSTYLQDNWNSIIESSFYTSSVFFISGLSSILIPLIHFYEPYYNNNSKNFVVNYVRIWCYSVILHCVLQWIFYNFFLLTYRHSFYSLLVFIPVSLLTLISCCIMEYLWWYIHQSSQSKVFIKGTNFLAISDNVTKNKHDNQLTIIINKLNNSHVYFKIKNYFIVIIPLLFVLATFIFVINIIF